MGGHNKEVVAIYNGHLKWFHFHHKQAKECHTPLRILALVNDHFSPSNARICPNKDCVQCSNTCSHVCYYVSIEHMPPKYGHNYSAVNLAGMMFYVATVPVKKNAP